MGCGEDYGVDVVRIVGWDVVSLRCGGCGEDCGEVEVRWMW